MVVWIRMRFGPFTASLHMSAGILAVRFETLRVARTDRTNFDS